MIIVLLLVPGVLVGLSLILLASTFLEKLAPRQPISTGDYLEHKATVFDEIATVIDPVS